MSKIGFTGFATYCRAMDSVAFPAGDAVASAYLLAQAEGPPGAMRNARRAIAEAHRRAGLPQPRIDPSVLTLERRRLPLPARLTVGDREVEMMLRGLDPMAPIDARDGTAIILMHVHGWGVEAIRAARVERVRFVEGGVEIDGSTLPDGDVETSLSPWLRAWMLHLGRETGALFAAWSRQGLWTNAPACARSINQAIRRAAVQAGVAARGAKGSALASAASIRGRRER